MALLVSVVIPTRDRADHLRTCLEGFAGQTVPFDRFEVVVVDDGSRSDVGRALDGLPEGLDVTLLRRHHQGVSAARNAGIAAARAPYLVLFDDDQRPVPDMLARCLAFHKKFPGEDKARLLTLVPELSRPRTAMSYLLFEERMAYAYPETGKPAGWEAFWGGAISCKRSLFRHAQFDPGYGMMEDIELGLRLSRRLPLAVLHIGRPDAEQTLLPSASGLMRRTMARGYWHHRFQRDYPDRVALDKRVVYRRSAEIVAALAHPHGVALRAQALLDAVQQIDPAPENPRSDPRLAKAIDVMRRLSLYAGAAGWHCGVSGGDLATALDRAFPLDAEAVRSTAP